MIATEAALGGGWTLNPIQLAAPAVLAGAYALRARGLARRGRRVPTPRQAAFYAGLAVVALATTSPIDTIGERRLLYVHMTQHLLLGDVAPLLIVVGLSGAVLRPLIVSRPVRRLRVLSHPFLALPLWALNLYVWHLAVLYQAAIRSEPLHAVEHLLFITTGALMWAAVVEPLPGPRWFGAGWKTVYTLVVRTLQAGLANVFLWSSVAFYAVYARGERVEGLSATQDQAIAGGIMLVEGGVVTLIVFAWAFLRWVRETEARQQLVEAGHDPVRAARAARYRPSPLGRRLGE